MKKLIIAVVLAASALITSQANAQIFRACWRYSAPTCSPRRLLASRFYYCAPASNACAPASQPKACAPVETQEREYVPGAPEDQTAQASQNAFLAAANRFRARFGLRPLVASSALETNAQTQASLCSRLGALIHARGATEILAQNGQGFETALNQWYNSPSHRAILLSPAVQYAGIGFVRDAYGRVWVAMQFK